MNIVRCDLENCPATRPADLDRTDWLEVRHDSLTTIGAVSWDFCGFGHLAAWAAGKALA